MIGDDDRRGAGLGGDLRIVDVENALDDQLARPDAADPLDVLPAEGVVELGGRPFGQRPDVLHALHMAGEIAEGPALARQDAVDPAAAWSPC